MTMCVCVSSERARRLKGRRRRLTREIIACIACVSDISRVDFLDGDDGWDVLMGCDYKKKERKKNERTNERTMGVLAIDDDGGDLAKGGEERARARGGRLLRTRLGSNL